MAIPIELPQEVEQPLNTEGAPHPDADAILAAHFTGKRSDFLRIAEVAAKGDLATLRVLIDYDPSLIHRWNSHGRTLLWEATRRGRFEVVRYLAERGADVNSTGCNLRETWVEVSPYCLAKAAKRDELARYLLANGAMIDAYTAAYLGELELLRLRLSDDPGALNRPHPQDREKCCLIHYAVSGGCAETVEHLLKHGAEAAAHSRRLLSLATRHKGNRLLELLLQYGADARSVVLTGDLLHDSPEAAKLLENHGASILQPEGDPDGGWTPLLYACRGDKGEHHARVQALLEAGADVTVRHTDGRTALHVAAKGGFARVIDVLLEYGAEVDAVDDEGKTPLVIGLLARRHQAVEALLKGGADPNLGTGKSQQPPLKKAMKTKDQELLKLLLDYGAHAKA